ncbi:MAG: PRC-barrel domain-containing protein [Patescibacteria group bacterium]
MFIEAKNLIGLPIAALDTQSKIAEIRKILVDPESGSVLGFLVSAGGIFSPKKVISSVDIRDWDRNGLVTESPNNLINPIDIVRIKEVLTQDFDLFGLKAKTESGKNLGSIENFLIETETNCVIKYYLKDLVLKARIYPAEKVVRIEKNAIIFMDDVEIPSGVAGAAA